MVKLQYQVNNFLEKKKKIQKIHHKVLNMKFNNRNGLI